MSDLSKPHECAEWIRSWQGHPRYLNKLRDAEMSMRVGVTSCATLVGKIAVRNGRVYFAHTSMAGSILGKALTTFHLIDARPTEVVEGEDCEAPGYNIVRTQNPKFHEFFTFRLMEPDGSRIANESTTPPAFSEESDVPCPKMRKGTEVRWSRHGWQKWNKRCKEWVTL